MSDSDGDPRAGFGARILSVCRLPFGVRGKVIISAFGPGWQGIKMNGAEIKYGVWQLHILLTEEEWGKAPGVRTFFRVGWA
jgi:hypothetical protein